MRTKSKIIPIHDRKSVDVLDRRASHEVIIAFMGAVGCGLPRINNVIRPLSLVVNNSARQINNGAQELKPNSPEITRIIRSIEEKLSW